MSKMSSSSSKLGIWKKWHENGKIQIREVFLDGGRRDRKEWYDDGQLCMESQSCNGKLTGERGLWYSNGRLMIRELYNNGKRTGKYRINYANGNPEMYRVQNGQFEGESKNWRSDGTLYEYCYLRNDLEIDSFFNIAKKFAFLKLKRFLRFRLKPRDIYTFLIPDLINLFEITFRK